MRRLFLTALILSLLTAVFTGCSKRAEEPPVELPPEPEIIVPAEMTDSQAAAHNAGISPSDVNLVQLTQPAVGSQMAVIRTNHGDIEVMLYPRFAPNAVENFTAHARSGYYTGLDFDKVMRNFIIEGGDSGGGGESIFGDERSRHEYSLNLWNFRGAVGMADLDGGFGSRFYIVHAPFVDADTLSAMEAANYPEKVIDAYRELGGVPGFDWQNTVFGMVTEESIQTVDAIARLPQNPDGSTDEFVLIQSIEIVTVDVSPQGDGEDDPG